MRNARVTGVIALQEYICGQLHAFQWIQRLGLADCHFRDDLPDGVMHIRSQPVADRDGFALLAPVLLMLTAACIAPDLPQT